MQPNTFLGARHHHTTLRVENNQSRRRPTSLSLSKLPVSGLYWKLFERGNTFLLDPPGTAGPIAEKTREKVELLSLSFLPLFSFLSFSPLPTVLLGLNSSLEGNLCPHVNTLDYLSPYPSTLDFSLIMCFHKSLMGPTWALCLNYPALDTWYTVNHSTCAKCPILPSVSRKT